MHFLDCARVPMGLGVSRVALVPMVLIIIQIVTVASRAATATLFVLLSAATVLPAKATGYATPRARVTASLGLPALTVIDVPPGTTSLMGPACIAMLPSPVLEMGDVCLTVRVNASLGLRGTRVTFVKTAALTFSLHANLLVMTVRVRRKAPLGSVQATEALWRWL